MGRLSPDEAERRLQSRLKERHFWERIGHRIRQRRIELDMSVQDLAEKVGLGINAIYRIEVGILGTVPNRLQDFANALQMDLTELIEEAPDPTVTALRAAFRGMPLTPEQIEEMARYAHEHFRPEGGSRQDS
jgi:transcriptional regulator with XRE-family HTH domain